MWLYFKKGRNEISFVYTAFNTILLISLVFDTTLTTNQYAMFGAGFIVASMVLGVFINNEVEPQNSVINPFTVDNMLSLITMMRAMQLSYGGEYDEAIKEMENAVLLREKWLK